MRDDGIAKIKEELLSAKELARVANCFFDWSEANQFLGNAIDCPRLLRAAVRAAVSDVLERKVALTLERWFRRDAMRFVHGTFCAGGRVCSALFFEDLAMGLVVIAGMNGEPTHFIRFASTGAPPTDPSRN